MRDDELEGCGGPIYALAAHWLPYVVLFAGELDVYGRPRSLAALEAKAATWRILFRTTADA